MNLDSNKQPLRGQGEIMENQMVQILKTHYDYIDKWDALKFLKKFYGHVEGWLPVAVKAYGKCEY